MVNDNKKEPRLAIAVIAVAAVMMVAATTEMAITGYVFAYNRNQATSGANACGNGQVPTNIGCQNIDSQIQGDENSVALTSQQTFPSVTREPPTTEPTGFTVDGTGTGTSGDEVSQVGCENGPTISGVTLDLTFSAQSDGTVSGTYTIGADGSPFREGVLTDGTTDGSTYSLTGEGQALCFDPVIGPPPPTGEVTISGNCGDDVTINYDDVQASGPFTGDVECTLI